MKAQGQLKESERKAEGKLKVTKRLLKCYEHNTYQQATKRFLKGYEEGYTTVTNRFPKRLRKG